MHPAATALDAAMHAHREPGARVLRHVKCDRLAMIAAKVVEIASSAHAIIHICTFLREVVEVAGIAAGKYLARMEASKDIDYTIGQPIPDFVVSPRSKCPHSREA